MASIPSNGYAEVMGGTNNYSGSNSYDATCPRTPVAPVIGNDLCNKTYVDAATGGGILSTLTDKGSLITANGTNPVIFDENPYQTALTTTTVYDWNSLAIGQSRNFTTTVPTLIPLGAGITITYSGTDSIKGNVTAVAGTTITITITNIASASYSSGFLIQTAIPTFTLGALASPYNLVIDPSITTPIPPNIPANTIISDGVCYVFDGGSGGNFFITLSGTNVVRGSSLSSPLPPSAGLPPTALSFSGANGGCFVGSTQVVSITVNATQPSIPGLFNGNTPPEFIGSLSGYTVTYGTGSIVIDDDIALIADALSPNGLAWGVINPASIGAVTSVSGGTNIVMSGTVPAPVVNLRNPLTAELNMGSQSLRDSASAVGTSGQLLSAGTGGQTLWTNPPPTNPTITDTNTNATYYPTFVSGSGTQPLLADISTGPISLNPSNGNFNVVTTMKLTQSQLSFGLNAGLISQGAGAVAIGLTAGSSSQGGSGIAIGNNAGNASQGSNAIALGQNAGKQSARANCIAIGLSAGELNQGQAGGSSVAVGESAGSFNQGGEAVALGGRAGATSQGAEAVATGGFAGETSQGIRTVAIGYQAAQTTQGQYSVAVGNGAGQTTQGTNAVAVGKEAGKTSQANFTIAIGNLAGSSSQALGSVAIGSEAGSSSQGTKSLAIGGEAGKTTQGTNAVAIGNQAGQTTQANFTIAIGHLAGSTSQALGSVAIGSEAGSSSQATNSIAIGGEAGKTTQASECVAVGKNAGQSSQATKSVAIGSAAGLTTQDAQAVAIGWTAGQNSQGFASVAIGSEAGFSQSFSSVAVGNSAGKTSQSNYAVAVGYLAGTNTQSANSVAVGVSAGETTQGSDCVAVGANAGKTSQGNGAVAIGLNAGLGSTTAQGANAIAIGANAGTASQLAGSICLNASGAALNPNQAGLFINPIRSLTGNQEQQLQYNPTTFEVIAFPNSNNVVMEDFDVFDTTAGFYGNRLSFAETGAGSVSYYQGVYEATILTGAEYRRGVIQMNSGGTGGNSTQLLTDLLFSYANISKVTFGIVPHTQEPLSVTPVPAGNTTQAVGIASATSGTSVQTSNTVIWRMTSSGGTVPAWQFVINNVVQYTLTIAPTNMTAKWCRAEIDVNYGGGATATVSGTWYNLTDGTSETTGTYTITAGAGFPAALTTPNTVGIYMACYTNNNTNKYLGVDYVEVQQSNLYPVGSGTTETTGR